MTPLRVVMATGSSHGADWFAPMCSGLAARGHEVTAIISHGPGNLGPRLEAQGVPWLSAELALRRPLSSRSRTAGRVGDCVRLTRAAAGLAQLLRELTPDVLVTHHFNATLLGRLAGAAAGVPLRCSMVPSPFTIEAPATRCLDRLTLRLDHAVIAGSDRIRTLYEQLGVAQSRLEVVYYGADAAAFDPAQAEPRLRHELGLAADVPLIGQVARFYAPIDGPFAPRKVRGRGVKGHEVFLQAARLVLQRRPDARFVLVGGAWGEPARRYRDGLIASARDVPEVRFVGERADIPDVLASLDVSVQCSLAENLGGTIESLLMERPTVASRVGGMPEAVIDERTGVLVEADQPEQLATAMLRLIEDRKGARRLAAEGRRWALSRFTFDRTIDDLDRIVRLRASRRMRDVSPAGTRRNRASAGRSG